MLYVVIINNMFVSNIIVSSHSVICGEQSYFLNLYLK